MNKPASIIKRGAAAVVMAGLLATALPATAMASTTYPNTNLTVEKTWNVNDHAQFENATFDFQLAYKKFIPQGTPETEPSDAIKATNETIHVNISEPEKGNSTTKSASVSEALKKIDFNLPGTYYFTLTEVIPTDKNPNIDYNIGEKTYEVVVNVKWAVDDNKQPRKDTVVNNWFIQQQGNTSIDAKSDKAAFVNGPADSGSLHIEKQVTGDAGETNKQFNFKLELTGGTQGEYTVTIHRKDGSTETKTVATLLDFTLADDEYAEVSNLPVRASYKVTEVDANEDSYTTTYAGLDEGNTGSISKKGEKDKVIVTNDKAFKPVTGIVLSTIPYIAAGGAAVAGAVTLVISRKRRAHEDF